MKKWWCFKFHRCWNWIEIERRETKEEIEVIFSCIKCGIYHSIKAIKCRKCNGFFMESFYKRHLSYHK